ncbi:MAG TPA: hypothetical protein IGS52_00790 [Oscillatoriaceae cyanobacterium M33_DOE_052]|uniref:Uncharacterized protein n=1 Tax=Planktothricoides sp. SpSt-374 TaxID=2282167 RepID=A0A7C3ZNF4_9CYAN|nr:hypothetical protein [Oscillatoriaceae cyanobacterium M33_DOE_052]
MTGSIRSIATPQSRAQPDYDKFLGLAPDDSPSGGSIRVINFGFFARHDSPECFPLRAYGGMLPVPPPLQFKSENC